MLHIVDAQIRHDGRMYKAGDDIDLTPAQAAKLPVHAKTQVKAPPKADTKAAKPKRSTKKAEPKPAEVDE